MAVPDAQGRVARSMTACGVAVEKTAFFSDSDPDFAPGRMADVVPHGSAHRFESMPNGDRLSRVVDEELFSLEANGPRDGGSGVSFETLPDLGRSR